LRECLYEKNVDFKSNYRSQKHVITAQIVRSVNIEFISCHFFFFEVY